MALLEHLHLEPWAMMQEVQLPCSCHPMRKLNHMERPYIGFPNDNPSFYWVAMCGNLSTVAKGQE